MGRTRIKIIVHPNANEGSWISLASCPFDGRTSLLKTNDDEFLAVSGNGLQANPNADGIYRYSVKSNNWARIMEFGKDFVMLGEALAIDQSKQLLFVGVQGRIYEIDLKSGYKKVLIENDRLRDMIKILCVGNSLHIFRQLWVVNEFEHYIINRGANKLEKMIQLDASNQLINGEALAQSSHLKSKDSLITFNSQSAEIYQYQNGNTEWKISKIKHPYKAIGDQAIVATINEQHLVALGGRDDVSGVTHSRGLIRVIDLQNESLSQLKIKCPSSSGDFRAITMRNEKRDELAVFGFVNQCFASSEYQNIQRLPFYLIRLIAEWISNEYIHLIDIENGKHWKIHIDHILDHEKPSLTS